MKPTIQSAAFYFDDKEGLSYRVKWTYLGLKTEGNSMNYKHWRVETIITYLPKTGIANRIFGDTWKTTLQPNLTNSADFLERNLTVGPAITSKGSTF